MAKKLDRDDLCRELLTIHAKHAAAFARMDEIKSLLKGDANGENYKITITGLGEVAVSAPRERELTGLTPELRLEGFLALTERERQKLIARGIVIEAEQWRAAYYGSVRTRLF